MKKAIQNLAVLAGPLAICTVVILLASGCHTSRKTMKAPHAIAPASPADTVSGTAGVSSMEVLEKVRSGVIGYHAFSARAKLDVQSQKGAQNGIAAFLRMKKDSAIWISIRPVLGIELVRVLITPDSVKMINFFKKTLTVRSTDSLEQLLNIPCNFTTLQELLIGNPVLLNDSLQDFRTDSAGVIAFSCIQGNLKSAYVFSSEDYRLMENDMQMLDTVAGPRSSRELFDGYKPFDGRNFSTARDILLETGAETTAEIRFSHVVFDGPVSFPFPEVADFRRN